jgi:hypothetical protein
LVVTSPVIRSRPNEVEARNPREPLSIDFAWAAPVEIAETGPFPGHYWHAEWVIRKYRINWDTVVLAKGLRRNLFVLINRKIISAIQSLADRSSK